MGLYGIYEIVRIFIFSFLGNVKMVTASIIVSGVTLIAWATLFILQGIGLYKMAKNRGIKKGFLAFIPFANIYYMGKLTGECVIFGQRMKRAGLYAMIMEAISTVFFILILLAELYLYLESGEPLINPMAGTPYWDVKGLGFLNTLANFHKIGINLLSIFQLLSGIFILILLSGLYKKYAPRQYFLLGFLTIMFPARYIIIFVLRNKKAIDYEAYIRARRDAYIRQQQQYNQQRGYGSPYSNPYNSPYGNGYGGRETPPKPEEPFEEFSNGKSSNTAENSEDEFFN